MKKNERTKSKKDNLLLIKNIEKIKNHKGQKHFSSGKNKEYIINLSNLKKEIKSYHLISPSKNNTNLLLPINPNKIISYNYKKLYSPNITD